MMMKTLVSLVCISSLILAGCESSAPVSPDASTTPDTTTTTTTTTTTPPSTTLADMTDIVTATWGKAKTPTSCADAISTYSTLSKTITPGAEVVAAQQTITVDYVGRLDDKTVFDTSVAFVAKSCNKYTEMRNYTEGLSFTVGAGQMIPGFDQGVVGMKIGETKTVTIPADKAYGKRDQNNVISVPLSQLPPLATGVAYKAGDTLQTPYGAKKISSMSGDSAMIDMNHELAGKDLIFDITIRSIK